MKLGCLMFDDSFSVPDLVEAAVYAGLVSSAVGAAWWRAIRGKQPGALPYGLRVLFAIGAGLIIGAIVFRDYPECRRGFMPRPGQRWSRTKKSRHKAAPTFGSGCSNRDS
jgi:hypothetical protein